MTKDEALKLALEFLEDNKHYIIENERREYLLMYEAVIDKCKEALAQPEDHRRGADNQKASEQEPVIGTKTWFEDGKVVTQYLYPSDIYTTPPQPEQEPVVQYIGVYITPPQRTWQGLTDEEIDYIYTGIRAVHHDVDSDVLCRAIEAKLKEKNT